MPIKKISKQEQRPFFEIVDEILLITNSADYLQNQSKQTQVKEYEKQIDQMVYKLYGLTEEEIKTVEEQTSGSVSSKQTREITSATEPYEYFTDESGRYPLIQLPNKTV